jgi:hypothetical protein
MTECPECRDGKPWNCAGFAFDADDNEVPCARAESTERQENR